MRAPSALLCTVLCAAPAAAQPAGAPPAPEPPEPAEEPAPEPPPPAEPKPEPTAAPKPEPQAEPQPEPQAEPAPQPKKPQRDPDEGIARPDGEDLRGLHPLIDLGAGVWVPSTPLFPSDLPGFGSPPVGVTANGSLALGLNRYVVLELQGGFAWAPADCDGCDAKSVVGGAAIAYHLAQGFAFDPWASFGMAYRHVFLTYQADPATAAAGEANASDQFSALDFVRLGLGGNFYPAPLFGFGPYIELDVGVRSFSDAVFYAAFHGGLRFSFDPLNAGATATPNLASR
jgi:hypothetical protein